MRQAQLQSEKQNADLHATIAELRKSLTESQKAFDDAQASLLDAQTQAEQRDGAKQAQIDMLSEELDRVNGHATAMEREKEQINSQYLELWRKHYAQPEEGDAEGAPNGGALSASARVAELTTALQSKDGRLKQLTLQVSLCLKGKGVVFAVADS